MDRETKVFLGKILGEVYRLQKAVAPEVCRADDTRIYGLLRGFEEHVNEELEEVSDGPTAAEAHEVIEVLNPYFTSNKALRGYYDIEHQLEERGINRVKAIEVLTMLKARGQFTKQIDEMDSSHSPSECRTFKLSI